MWLCLDAEEVCSLYELVLRFGVAFWISVRLLLKWFIGLLRGSLDDLSWFCRKYREIGIEYSILIEIEYRSAKSLFFSLKTLLKF